MPLVIGYLEDTLNTVYGYYLLIYNNLHIFSLVFACRRHIAFIRCFLSLFSNLPFTVLDLLLREVYLSNSQ